MRRAVVRRAVERPLKNAVSDSLSPCPRRLEYGVFKVSRNAFLCRGDRRGWISKGLGEERFP